jgi:hypothetical protein
MLCEKDKNRENKKVLLDNRQAFMNSTYVLSSFIVQLTYFIYFIHRFE